MDEIMRYKEELNKVENLLKEPNLTEEGRKEYVARKKDLVELVYLMEEEEQASTSQKREEQEEEEEEEDDQVIGSRCLAPFEADKSLPGHSAIIMEVEETHVRVLYSHPTCNAMRPCSHFLKSQCRFGSNCRFSHGALIPLERIMDYKEPNYEIIKMDCLVLTKSTAELWELGRISAIDGRNLAVKLLKSNMEIMANWAGIVPIEESEETQPQRNREESSWPELKKDEKSATKKLGIDGIGMKLMQKMGYQIGEGLGKNSDGIVHAIQARICPKNASIDECMKRKRKVVDGKSETATKKKNKAIVPEEKDIFNFINRSLAGTSKPAQKPDEKLDKCDIKELEVKRMEMDIRMTKFKAQIKRLKDGIERNKADPYTLDRFKQGLKQVEDKVADLQRQITIVARELEARSKKKKDIF